MILQFFCFFLEFSSGLCRILTIPCKKPEIIAGVKDIWEESRENVELEEIIGHGNFGEVYKGKLDYLQNSDFD
jgi:hypothetical protein